ncbi:MAG: thioesterase, partial [Epsilonproteobacteria bacterium]
LGLLHGGASCVLAESLGSIAANMALDTSKEYAVGLEINANHIRSVTSGIVTGTAKPIHLGRKTQIWEIKIKNEEGKLTCISRLTMAVMKKGGS